MTKQEEVIAKLEQNALTKKEVAAQLRRESARTSELVVQGVKLGVPKAALSRAAGVTRQTIYGMLYRKGVKV